MITRAAKVARDYFYDDGSVRDGCWFIKRPAPGWVSNLSHHAHDDMGPDDFLYEFIVNALDMIMDGLDSEDVEYEISNYTLLAWISSSMFRVAYDDDAVSDFGHRNGIMEDIQQGQFAERIEVLDLVHGWLNDNTDEVLLEDTSERDDNDIQPF